MKFINSIALILSLSYSITAAPVLEKKQNTPVSAIGASVATLQGAVNSYEGSITNAVTAIKGNIFAYAQLIAAVGVNLAGIASALTTAENGIVTATTGAAGGLATTAQGLVQADVDSLTYDVNEAVALIKGIQATLAVTATDLTPQALATVASEVDAVNSALALFITPLQQFAAAVQKASATAQLTVTGLNAAIAGLAGLVIPTVDVITGLPLHS